MLLRKNLHMKSSSSFRAVLQRFKLVIRCGLFLLLSPYVGFCSPDDPPSRSVTRFEQLIENNYGLKVREWSGQAGDLLSSAAQATCEQLNDSPLDFDRTNELGLAIERKLEDALRTLGVNCHIPKTVSGRSQSAGYPDLTFEYEGEDYYLEVKTFSSYTIESSQRTFYFTVSDDPKVTVDAYHLLIGFEIEKEDDSQYRILRYHIVDLRQLSCKVKIEYNASNQDLYRNSLPGYKILGEVKME